MTYISQKRKLDVTVLLILVLGRWVDVAANLVPSPCAFDCALHRGVGLYSGILGVPRCVDGAVLLRIDSLVLR